MDISIIICSRNRTTNTELVQNIHDTIGTSYEIIHIDNESGQYGISAAYNKGVEEARGDILCFMHDDVRYHSDGWGLRVKDYFSCTNLGMLGVAGSMIVPERGDWRFLDPRYHVIRLIQGISSPRGKYYARGMLWKATGGLKQVAILDGVWFCIRKKTFQSVRFDDVSFPHFHFYDSDISMQINALGQNVSICDDILLEHFSEGMFSLDFYKGLDLFLAKWRKYLPVINIIDGTHVTLEEMERQNNLAVSRLERRLKEDRALQNFRVAQVNADYKSLSSAELRMIRNQEYGFVKKLIKTSAPMSMAWGAFRAFPSKYWFLKLKLFCKLLYYYSLHPSSLMCPYCVTEH